MAIITISRGTMSGGEKLSEMLAERLGYRCVSREVIVKAADDYGVSESKLFDAVQKSPTLLDKLGSDRERYLAYLQASLCEYAKDDNLIYHGNAGHLLLQGVSHVLRVRLVADMRYRIKAAMERLQISEKDAIKHIERVDKERAAWTRFLYGLDWRSPELYDLVFNLEHAGLNFVCGMVAHAVKQPEFQATPESSEAMQNLLLASRVRAALAQSADIRLDELRVEARGATVTISGRVWSQQVLEFAVETARKVPGVESIQNEMKIDYRSYATE